MRSGAAYEASRPSHRQQMTARLARQRTPRPIVGLTPPAEASDATLRQPGSGSHVCGGV